MADQRLTFDLKMQGGHEVESTLRRLSESLNQMPKGAERGLQELNRSISDIVKSLNTISSASGGFTNVGKSIENAMGSTNANLVRGLSKEIGSLQTEIDKLTQKTERYNQVAEKAREAGRIGLAERAEARSARYGVEALEAQGNLSNAQAAVARAKYGEPNPQTGGGIANAALGALGLPAMSGMGGAAFIAAALAASGNYYQLGAKTAIEQRSYYTQGARESVYGGDPLRTMLRQQGLGPEAEFANNKSGLFDTLLGNLRLVKNQFQTGSMERGRIKTANELGDLSMQEYAEGSTINKFRQTIGSSANDLERSFGIGGAQNALGVVGGGVTAEMAIPTLNTMAAYGLRGGATDRNLIRSNIDYGTSQNLIGVAAQREAFLGRTAGARGGTSGDILDVYGAAGFGASSDLAARGVTSNFLAQEYQSRNLLGTESIGQIGGAFSAASAAITARTGNALAPVDVAGIAGQYAGSERQGLNTAFDPRRTMALQTLMGLGFNATEAEGFIRSGLDKSSTRDSINNILRQRGNKGAGDIVGSAVSNREKQVFGGFENAIGASVSADVRSAFPSLGKQILYGEESAAVAEARSATQGTFTTGRVAGGRTGVSAPVTTTESQQRVEQAAVDKQLVTSLQALTEKIQSAQTDQNQPLVKSLDALTRALQERTPLQQPKERVFPAVIQPGRQGR